MSEKISQYLRLKENNSTYKKFDELCAKAEELGLTLYFDSGVLSISDKDSEYTGIRVVDVENRDYPQYDFPPTMEFLILCDNPKYLEKLKLEREQYAKLAEEKKKEEARLQEERLKKAMQQKAERLAQQKAALEAEEKETLRILKEKYPDP